MSDVFAQNQAKEASMTPHAWKCVTCVKAFRSAKDSARQPNCPHCGNPLAPFLPKSPTPQPRPRVATANGKSHAPVPRAASSTRRAASGRPSDPATALATVSSSSPWMPDAEPGPSPQTPGYDIPLSRPSRVMRDVEPEEAVTPAPFNAPTAARQPFPWAAASIGGAVVSVLAFAIFLATRPGPSTASAQHADAPAPQLATIAQPPAPEPPPSFAPPAAPRVVNLLRLINPTHDAVNGIWQLKTGEFAPELVSDATHHARIGIPYLPPQEYNFRVDFTRQSGDNCMTQIFTHRNPAALVLFGWKGTVCGFQQIADHSAEYNVTGVRGIPTENGQRHVSIIRVRKHSIESWLDGKLITRYDTDGTDLASKDWAVSSPLGVGSQLSPTTFHTIELTEISGQGHALR